MKIWICMPVFNRKSYTLQCLESLSNQSQKNFEIVICDHGSTDGTSDSIKTDYPDTIVLEESEDLWWTGAINRCVEYVLENRSSEDDYILTLNNDLVVEPTYLEKLAEAGQRYSKSIITSASHDIESRKLVDSGLKQNWLTSKVKKLDPHRDILPDGGKCAIVTHAPGRGTLIPLRAFLDVGLYDEKHLPHYGADYDFTFRANKLGGYISYICFDAKLFSHVDATGMTGIRSELSWKAFRRYLTNIKSPANLSARYWLALNNCPRLLLPSFLLLDFAFIVGSYFKFHLLKKRNS
jgi:GT2 family glycosyltransferase